MAFAESNRRSGRVNHRLPLVAGESGRHGEVRFADEFSNRRESVAKMIDRLGAKHGILTFFYEAGPCVFGLHLQTTIMGCDWVVVARSLVPTLSLNKPA